MISQDIIDKLNAIPIPEELQNCIREKGWVIGDGRPELRYIRPTVERVLFFDKGKNVIKLNMLFGLELADLEVLTDYCDECLEILDPPKGSDLEN
jgi:hypothetical protein